ncbi:hypothetical protein V6N11_009055 [Hibiscus sabdariffa]|uniref:Uncharacterized protein n=2 Tax=Hibiscus sabdariffa TaxID=183260 RepID=A0ABR2AHY8_9ROSI
MVRAVVVGAIRGLRLKGNGVSSMGGVVEWVGFGRRDMGDGLSHGSVSGGLGACSSDGGLMGAGNGHHSRWGVGRRSRFNAGVTECR